MVQKIENVAEYYVYVYIDPRNNEEFYYGKGKGSRKEAHLEDKTTSRKAMRIQEIKSAGFEPIIRVIAKNLTEEQAFLVEKTLIWKFEKTLLNEATGHFSEEFRPQDTLHLELAGFDFQNGLYYVNFSEGRNKARHWEDCRKYGFIVAGGGQKYSEPLKKLNIGDIIVVYMGGLEYLGIGRVKEKAVIVNDFLYNGLSLREFIDMDKPNIFDNFNNDVENAQWLVKVEWIKTISEEDAKKRKNRRKNIDNIKIYFSRQMITTLNDTTTLEFLEDKFGVKFRELLTA
jgi:hypothetical protein